MPQLPFGAADTRPLWAFQDPGLGATLGEGIGGVLQAFTAAQQNQQAQMMAQQEMEMRKQEFAQRQLEGKLQMEDTRLRQLALKDQMADKKRERDREIELGGAVRRGTAKPKLQSSTPETALQYLNQPSLGGQTGGISPGGMGPSGWEAGLQGLSDPSVIPYLAAMGSMGQGPMAPQPKPQGLMEVSPWASVYDPATGQFFQAPGDPTDWLRGGGGGGGGTVPSQESKLPWYSNTEKMWAARRAEAENRLTGSTRAIEAGQLAKGLDGGKLRNIEQQALEWGKALGMTNVKGNLRVSQGQAYFNETQKLVLEILRDRSLGSGNGITDADREYARNLAGNNLTLTSETMRGIMRTYLLLQAAKLDQYKKQVDVSKNSYRGVSPDIFESTFGLEGLDEQIAELRAQAEDIMSTRERDAIISGKHSLDDRLKGSNFVRSLTKP